MAITRSQIARQLLQQGGVSMVDPRMKRSLQENIARNEIQRELSSAVRSGNFRDFLLKNVGAPGATRFRTMYGGFGGQGPFTGTYQFMKDTLIDDIARKRRMDAEAAGGQAGSNFGPPRKSPLQLKIESNQKILRDYLDKIGGPVPGVDPMSGQPQTPFYEQQGLLSQLKPLSFEEQMGGETFETLSDLDQYNMAQIFPEFESQRRNQAFTPAPGTSEGIDIFNRRFGLKKGGMPTLKDAKENAPPGEFLAYINPKEADMLRAAGGSGIMTAMGIPSFIDYGDVESGLASQDQVDSFTGGGSDGFEGEEGPRPTYSQQLTNIQQGGDGFTSPPMVMTDPDKFDREPAPSVARSFFDRITGPLGDARQNLSINYIRNELERRKPDNYSKTLAGRLGFKPNETPFDTSKYKTRTEELEDALTRAIVGENVTATIQGNRNKGDGGGDNEFMPTLFRQNLVPEPKEPEKTGIEKVLADADEFRFLLPERFKLEEGGIVPRQAYGLGSIVKSVTKPFKKAAKKATRAVKKIAKSDLGKLALAAATIYFAPQLAGRLPAAKNPMSFLGQLQAKNPSRIGALKTLLPGGTDPFTGETSGISKLIKSLGGGTDFQVSGSALKPTGDIDALGRIFSEGKKLAALPEGLKSVALSGGKEAAKSTLLRDLALIGGPSILAGALAKEDIEDEDLDAVIAEARKDDSGLPELLAQYDDFRFVVPEQYRQTAAEGGMMDLGGNEMDLRGGGFVPIGREEKADDVPARLSKNEFVFTADAVRAAGGGSVDKGADLMYKTMKQLENKVA